MGMETFINLLKKSNFPWILSNVFDADLFDDDTKDALAQAYCK